MSKPLSPRLVSRWSLHTVLPMLALAGCAEDPDTQTAPPPEARPKTSCELDHREGSTGQSNQAVIGGDASPVDTSVSLSEGQLDAVGALVRPYNGQNHTLCSATLITQTVVLTAAHCVVDYTKWDGVSEVTPDLLVSPSMIRFGIGDDMSAPEALLEIAEVRVPPNLVTLHGDRRTFPSAFGMQPDLALLLLAQPAEQSHAGIEPIAIREVPLEQSLGQEVLLGGFGISDGNGHLGTRYWTYFDLSDDNALVMKADYRPGAGFVQSGDSGSGSLTVDPDGRVNVIAATTGPVYPAAANFGGNVQRSLEWLYQTVSTECSTVGEAGVCEDGVARWCDSGRVIHDDCTAQALSCRNDSCGRARCAPAVAVDPRCADLDYFGRCGAGEVLEWCVDGEYRRRTCALQGQVCAPTGNPWVGHDCVDEGTEPGWTEPPDPDAIADCEQLDACISACNSDMWCALECFARADKQTIARYSSFGLCILCATSPDYCPAASGPLGACETPCGYPPVSSIACNACLSDACGRQADHCAGG